MCIHLWRVLTTVHPISGRGFRTYAWYALGLPLICFVVCFVYNVCIALSDELAKLARGKSLFPMGKFFRSLSQSSLVLTWFWTGSRQNA